MPNAKFDSKSFNAEAFKYMVGRVPNLNMNEIKKSKALAGNPDIKDVFSSQNGAAYARIAMRGLLEGDAVNYDGSTNITASATKTFEQGVVVVGRAKGFVERDFSYDVTAGVDFMQNIADQVAEYKDKLDQDTILAILEGIFKMSGDTKSVEFVQKHTLDITGEVTKTVGATTLNTAMNKACGANKKKFALVFMHSDVATGLENLNLIEHLKYTDANGVQRSLDLGTWNGKLVIIDDAMPTEEAVATQGVWDIEVKTAAVAGDTIEICGKTFTWIANGGTPSADEIELPSTNNVTNEATAIYTKLAAITTGDIAKFTWDNTTAKHIGATQKTTAPGAICTAEVGVGATMVIDLSETTAPVEATDYTSYVLGEGSFSYEDVGVKVPYEMARDAATNGGQDTLYIRQRKCFAPFGISYEKAVQSTTSPTDAELKNGANWVLVHTGETQASDRSYINHKAVAIAKIISRG